jgi:hypothetical protein
MLPRSGLVVHDSSHKRNDRTLEITLTKDGKVTVTGRIVVSGRWQVPHYHPMKRVLKANITSKAKLAPAGRPRKDHRGVTLISNALPFVGCGTVSRTQSAMPVATQSFAPVQMML